MANPNETLLLPNNCELVLNVELVEWLFLLACFPFFAAAALRSGGGGEALFF